MVLLSVPQVGPVELEEVVLFWRQRVEAAVVLSWRQRAEEEVLSC